MKLIAQTFASNDKIAKLACEVVAEETKLACSSIKEMSEKKSKIAISKTSRSGAELESAFLESAMTKHRDLLTKTVGHIDETINNAKGLVRLVRKQRTLINHTLQNLPENVFRRDAFDVKYRGRTVKGLKIAASCVRLGGVYSVTMKKMTVSPESLDEDKKVFPDNPRDGFVLDQIYPLVGFEETAEGNTVAVFLTGIALGKKPPKSVSSTEVDSGFYQLFMLGYRLAKIPVVCMFGYAEADIELKDFEQSVSDMFPTTQPELDREKIREERTYFDSAPATSTEVFVHETRVLDSSVENLIFSLSPTQVDIMGNSWCNENASRSVKSGGFSGEISGVNTAEMNDISCFSDCIDVHVATTGGEICVVVESDRRLFDENSSPFTKVDAEKYNIKTVSKRSNKTEPSSDVEKNNLTTDEATVIDHLKAWNYEKYEDESAATEESRVSWWCSYSPPLKILNEISGSSDDVEDCDEEVAYRVACCETDAVIKSAAMAETECEISKGLRETIYTAFAKMNKAPSLSSAFRLTTSKLKQMLEEIDMKAQKHPEVWTPDSVSAAKGLMVDEAAAACVAQQLTADIINNKFSLLSGITNDSENLIKRKYEGQRRHATGNIPIVLSALKSEHEQLIDKSLKEWITNSLPVIAPTPNVYTPKTMAPSSSSSSSSSSLSEKKRSAATAAAQNCLPRKMLKNEEGNSLVTASAYLELSPPPSTSFSSSPSPPSPVAGDEEVAADAAVADTTTTTFDVGTEAAPTINYSAVSVIPPSFVKPPRINNGKVAEYLADAIGRRLCGINNNVNTFNFIRGAIKGLRKSLLDKPLDRFDTCEQISNIIFDTSKLSSVEKCEMDILEYEAKRLSKAMVKSSHTHAASSSFSFEDFIDSDCEDEDVMDFYRRYNELFEKSSKSWAMDAELDRPEIKTLLGANCMRRIYEEYNAYKTFVHLLIFNTVKRELEGSNYTYNAALASAFAWYCTVVVRNRVCDVLKYVPAATDEDSIPSDGNYAEDVVKKFIERLCENSMVLSIVDNSVTTALGWMSTIKVPSGYLKCGVGSEINKSEMMTCDSLDETSRYIFPGIVRGEEIGEVRHAIRAGANVLGPYLIPIDFSGVGISDATHAKLFINSSSGKGLLSVSPVYATSDSVSDNASIFERHLVHFVAKDSYFHNSKNMALPTFISAPTNPGNKFFNGKGTSTFVKNTPSFSLSASASPSTVPRMAAQKTAWDEDKHYRSSNMWRCGISVPAKICDIIYTNRSIVKIEATHPNKVKMCPSIADKLEMTHFRTSQKVCRSLNNFSRNSPKLMTGNLLACPPSDMTLNINTVVSTAAAYTGAAITATTTNLATCKITQDDYMGGIDNYGSSFFHFTVKTVKTSAATEGRESNNKTNTPSKAKPFPTQEPEDSGVNASIVYDMMNTTIKHLKKLQKIQVKNVDAIKTYARKNMA